MSKQYEAAEQTALFRWVAFISATLPEAELLYHIPNGGRRYYRDAVALKRQGVRAGVPDLCLPVSRGPYHGLYIELKYGKNKATDKQNEWLAKLRLQGYAAVVCYGWMSAAETIEAYLKKGVVFDGQAVL